MFACRAQVLRSFGQAEEAVRAGEAAVALYPHPAICGVARESVNASRSGLIPPVYGLTLNGRLLRKAEPGYKLYPTETRVRLLRAVLREFDLEDLGREFTALHPDEARQRLPLYNGGGWSSGMEYLLEIHPDEVEVVQLRQELFERTLARHLRRLDEFAERWNEPLPANRHGDHPQLFWLKEIWEGVSWLKHWAISDQQWARHIQPEIDRA